MAADLETAYDEAVVAARAEQLGHVTGQKFLLDALKRREQEIVDALYADDVKGTDAIPEDLVKFYEGIGLPAPSQVGNPVSITTLTNDVAALREFARTLGYRP